MNKKESDAPHSQAFQGNSPCLNVNRIRDVPVPWMAAWVGDAKSLCTPIRQRHRQCYLQQGLRA